MKNPRFLSCFPRGVLCVFLTLLLGCSTSSFGVPFSENTNIGIHEAVSTTQGNVASLPASLPEKGFHVRIAGYNIAHARGSTAGNFLQEMAKPKNLDGIGSLLKDSAVDVCGLTEVSNGDLRAGFQNQPQHIAKKLGFHFVYGENVSRVFGLMATQGNAIISRFPILSSTNHKLWRKNKKNEQRSCLEGLLDLGKNRRLRVFIGHLSLDSEESTRQIEDIYSMISKSAEPVVLIGDFNSRPKSDRIKWLSERMTDASVKIDTTYMNKPGVKIDYQFMKGGIRAGTPSVAGFKEGYSDHGCLMNDYWIDDEE
ncbi:MAG: endonuclease/exonuclease/phosphatase family protein [Candidatus Ozemobacteraceae bacterium]